MSTSVGLSNYDKAISLLYMIGGIFGAVQVASALSGAVLGFVETIVWLFLIAQVVAAIYGGWQYWNNKAIGIQVLYWLSYTCIPVITFKFLSYYCAIGLGAFPVLEFGSDHFGFNFYFRFGYSGELYLFPRANGSTAGVNLVAIGLVVALTKTMKDRGIARWPVAL